MAKANTIPANGVPSAGQQSDAEQELKLAQEEFKLPPLLTDSEIEEILTVIPDLTKWANEIMAYATESAVSHGKQWNGFKVVEGRSVRKYKDENEVAKAAKEAGFEGIGLRAETYVDALNEGLFDADILAILEKYDMKVTEVEYIVQWAEDHRSYEQKYKEQMCFHMCELFGVNHINCGLMENYSVAHTTQKLKELCHRAGKYTIGVEPMPYSGLPDVKKAWAVVKESGCENAKLILDSWHWLRANQPVDLSVLEGIPAEKIVSVQINDVYERPYAASILRDESMHDRLAPGTGCGNTAAFCRMLKEKGIEPKAMGVEVISDAILAKGVAAAAKFNFDNTVKVLQEGWPEAMPEK